MWLTVAESCRGSAAGTGNSVVAQRGHRRSPGQAGPGRAAAFHWARGGEEGAEGMELGAPVPPQDPCPSCMPQAGAVPGS